MKLVCIGDSLTTGYGVSKDENFIQLAKNRLTIEIINKGVNGDTTAGMLSRSYCDVVMNNPTHSFIMGGHNDFIAGRSLNMVLGNIRELIKESIQYNIIPIIGIEPSINKDLAKKRWSENVNYDKVDSVEEEYRQSIIQIANSNNILYVDFYQHFKNTLKTKNPKTIYVDGLHPTAFGHKLIADYFIFSLKNIIKML